MSQPVEQVSQARLDEITAKEKAAYAARKERKVPGYMIQRLSARMAMRLLGDADLDDADLDAAMKRLS